MGHLSLSAFIAALVLLGGLVGSPSLRHFVDTSAGEAAAFFAESISADQIRVDYRGVAAFNETHTHKLKPRGPLKILIVPGHQPNYGGAQFKGAYERDIVVDIADDLAAYLRQDRGVEVMVARSKSVWDPELATYFATHASDIQAFRADQAMQMATHLADKSVLLSADDVYHLDAPTFAALQLYGINKWATENGYDITIHLHVNDYSRRGREKLYTGYAVYVPDAQYSNAKASTELGEDIAHRLAAHYATSTLPGEALGVVPDQHLIAIGSNNSAEDAALLIEYGYIYEPQFVNIAQRPAAEQEYALTTYLGIHDFLGDPVASSTGAL